MAKKSKHEVLSNEKNSLVALKDFHIHQNKYSRAIHVGDDLSDVPEMYLQNLVTEGVLQTKEGD